MSNYKLLLAILLSLLSVDSVYAISKSPVAWPSYTDYLQITINPSYMSGYTNLNSSGNGFNVTFEGCAPDNTYCTYEISGIGQGYGFITFGSTDWQHYCQFYINDGSAVYTEFNQPPSCVGGDGAGALQSSDIHHYQVHMW